MQSGLRKQRSTTDNLVRLETFIREAFVQKQHAVAIFFDLEKAYDTTWKHGIMKDLGIWPMSSTLTPRRLLNRRLIMDNGYSFN